MQVFEKLLQSSGSILSEEVKLELKQEFDKQVVALREQIESEVRLDLARQWGDSKIELATQIDNIIKQQITESIADLTLDISETKLEVEKAKLDEEVFIQSVDDFINREIKDLYEDIEIQRKNNEILVNTINSFLDAELTPLKESLINQKDLEVVYAKKLAEERQRLASEVASDIEQLAENLNTYLDLTITKEMEVLKEDIEAAKMNDLGLQFFESLKPIFTQYIAKDEKTVSTKSLIKTVEEKDKTIKELTESLNKEKRKATLNMLLSNLEAGVKREQMSIILESVATDKLTDTYNEFLPKILDNSSVNSINNNKSNITLNSLFEENARIVTGNKSTKQSANKSTDTTSDIVARMMKNAGLTQ